MFDIRLDTLEDNVSNIITQGFLMAEELNLYLSSMFAR